MGRLISASTIGICFLVLVWVFSVRLMYGSNHESSDEPALGMTSFRFHVVPGVFQPSEDDTSPDGYDFITSNLGLKARTYDDIKSDDSTISQWERLEDYVDTLNEQAKAGVQYKVLFLGRHGEGWHNVAETKYGTKEWDARWSLLESDDTMHWADAHLTPTGEKQALAAHAFFAKQLMLGLPAPESYYSSPLTRCLQTCSFTYNDLIVPESRPFRPVTVKELLRETNGEHTCDRRSSLTRLRATLPEAFVSTFAFEPGFSDEDKLWKADERETHQDTQNRLRIALEDIFENDKKTWISVTSHSGAIRAMLAVFGHRPFPLTQGSMIAVLVKAEKVGT